MVWIACNFCQGVVHVDWYLLNCHRRVCDNVNCNAVPRPADRGHAYENGSLHYISFSDDDRVEFNLSPTKEHEVYKFICIVVDEDGVEQACFDTGEYLPRLNKVNWKKEQFYATGNIRPTRRQPPRGYEQREAERRHRRHHRHRH